MSERRSNRRLRGDEGAAIVEFALFGPFLVLISLGIFEFGLAWREVQVIERTTEASGRAVSTFGAFNSSFADYDALQAVNAGLSGLDHVELRKVIIYRSTTTNGQPTAGCLAAAVPGGVNGQCNVYSPSQVATTNPSGFPRGTISAPICAGGSWDIRWCFTSRQRDPTNGADYIGVWIEADYRSFTGLLPTTVTIERNAVFQLEPLPNIPNIP